MQNETTRLRGSMCHCRVKSKVLKIAEAMLTTPKPTSTPRSTPTRAEPRS